MRRARPVVSVAALIASVVSAAACAEPHGAGGPSTPAASAPATTAAVTATATPTTAPAASSAPSETASTPEPAMNTASPVDDARAANAFALKLYAREAKAKKGGGNVLVSGTSLRQALGVAYLGAHGDTAREMAMALELPADAKVAAATAKADLAAWQSARGQAELVVANRLWTDKSLALQPEFVATATAAYGAAPEAVDFKGGAEPARKTINAWVAKTTNDKIQELLAAGTLDETTRAVVTNAVYFKGRWPMPFPKTATKPEAFHVAAGKTSTVPMMHATESHRLAEVSGTKVLEMRYDTSEVAMLVVLPAAATGLAKLEESLSADTFASWTQALKHQRVAVTLPKFTFRGGGVMTPTLQDLGMKTAFTNKADFAGIAEPRGTDRIQISHVVQQTYIAVDENGTEAAAATAAVMSTTGMPIGEPAQFKADRPFLFFLYDVKRGRVLFAGRVTDPK